MMAACVRRGLFEEASVGVRLGLLPAVSATRTEAERPGPAHYLMPPRAAEARGRRAWCGGWHSVSWFIVLLRVLCCMVHLPSCRVSLASVRVVTFLRSAMLLFSVLFVVVAFSAFTRCPLIHHPLALVPL